MVLSAIFADNLINIKQNSIQMNSISISNETIQNQTYSGNYDSFDSYNVEFKECVLQDGQYANVELNAVKFDLCRIGNCTWEGNEAQATFRQCLIDGSIMKHDQPSQYRFEGSIIAQKSRISITGDGEILMARCLCKDVAFCVQSFTADGTFTPEFYDATDLSLYPVKGYEKLCYFEGCYFEGNSLPTNMRLSGCVFRNCVFHNITFKKFWAVGCTFIDCEWIDCSLEREESGLSWFGKNGGMMYNIGFLGNNFIGCRGEEQIFGR